MSVPLFLVLDNLSFLDYLIPRQRGEARMRIQKKKERRIVRKSARMV